MMILPADVMFIKSFKKIVPLNLEFTCFQTFVVSFQIENFYEFFLA